MYNYKLWMQVIHKNSGGTVLSSSEYPMFVAPKSADFVGKYDHSDLLKYCKVDAWDSRIVYSDSVALTLSSDGKTLTAASALFTKYMVDKSVWVGASFYKIVKYINNRLVYVVPAEFIVENMTQSPFLIQTEIPATSELFNYHDRLVYNTTKTFSFTNAHIDDGNTYIDSICEFGVSPEEDKLFGYFSIPDDGLELDYGESVDVTFTLQKELVYSDLQNIDFFQMMSVGRLQGILLSDKYTELDFGGITIPKAADIPLFDLTCSSFQIVFKDANLKILKSYSVSTRYKDGTYIHQWSVPSTASDPLIEAAYIDFVSIDEANKHNGLRFATQLSTHYYDIGPSTITAGWTFYNVPYAVWRGTETVTRDDLYRKELVARTLPTTELGQMYAGGFTVRQTEDPSAGPSVLETGYVPTAGDVIEFDIQFCHNSAETSATPVLIGCSDNGGCLHLSNGSGTGDFFSVDIGSVSISSTKPADTLRHTHRIDTANGIYSIDGIGVATFLPNAMVTLTVALSLYGTTIKSGAGDLSHNPVAAPIIQYGFRVWREKLPILDLRPSYRHPVLNTDLTITGILNGFVCSVTGTNYSNEGVLWTIDPLVTIETGNYLGYGRFTEANEDYDVDEINQPDPCTIGTLTGEIAALQNEDDLLLSVTVTPEWIYYGRRDGSIYRAHINTPTTYTKIATINCAISALYYTQYQFIVGTEEGTLLLYDLDWNFIENISITSLSIAYLGPMVGLVHNSSVELPSTHFFGGVELRPVDGHMQIIAPFESTKVCSISKYNGTLYVGTTSNIYKQCENGRWETLLWSVTGGLESPHYVGLHVFPGSISCISKNFEERGWFEFIGYNDENQIQTTIEGFLCPERTGAPQYVGTTTGCFDTIRQCWWYITGTNALIRQDMISPFFCVPTENLIIPNDQYLGSTATPFTNPLHNFTFEATITLPSKQATLLFATSTDNNSFNIFVEDGRLYMGVRSSSNTSLPIFEQFTIIAQSKEVLKYCVRDTIYVNVDLDTHTVRGYLNDTLIAFGKWDPALITEFVWNSVYYVKSLNKTYTEAARCIHRLTCTLDGNVHYEVDGTSYSRLWNVISGYVPCWGGIPLLSSWGYSFSPHRYNYSNNLLNWEFTGAVSTAEGIVVTNGHNFMISDYNVNPDSTWSLKTVVSFDYRCTSGDGLCIGTYDPSSEGDYTLKSMDDLKDLPYYKIPTDTSGQLNHVIWIVDGDQPKIGIGSASSTIPFTGVISNLQITNTVDS